jgi:CRISPR/Cas system-associated exonuclease Cas4 (RecB family)
MEIDDGQATADTTDARVTGTEVHYFVLCPRKLWWFSHGMEQEHVGQHTLGVAYAATLTDRASAVGIGRGKPSSRSPRK